MNDVPHIAMTCPNCGHQEPFAKDGKFPRNHYHGDFQPVACPECGTVFAAFDCVYKPRSVGRGFTESHIDDPAQSPPPWFVEIPPFKGTEFDYERSIPEEIKQCLSLWYDSLPEPARDWLGNKFSGQVAIGFCAGFAEAQRLALRRQQLREAAKS